MAATDSMCSLGGYVTDDTQMTLATCLRACGRERLARAGAAWGAGRG